MADLWWCETHGCGRFSGEIPSVPGVCDEWLAYYPAQPCQVVRLRPSRNAEGRLLGLLVEEKCEAVEVVYTNYLEEDDCPACGGSGWRLRAPIQNLAHPEAVLPLGKETT